MRAGGLSLHKISLFSWAIFVTAVLLLLSLPVLAGTNCNLPALNSAICWKLLYNITQSAGNLLNLNLLGILRDYTPELSVVNVKSIFITQLKFFTYYSLNNDNNNKINLNYNSNLNFSYYLAGLIEGDGTIIVPKSERSPKGRLNYPSIQIVFNLKDLPLALLIKKNLGHGSINRKKGVNAYIFTINNLEGLILLVNLLNGKLRTNKIYAFWNLIDWLNNKNYTSNKDLGTLNKNPIDNSLLTSNSWLAGFIEADGHFSVRTSMSGKYPKFECKFELSQRQNDHNNFNNLFFLEPIALLLLTTVKSIRLNSLDKQYRIRTNSLQGNIVLENYLNNFPLFGTKYLNFKDWISVLIFFKLRLNKSKEIKDQIIAIKSNMNDSRTIFNWDHLQNFYNLDK